MTSAKTRTGLGLFAATLVVTFSGTALAGNDREHDGFYLRMGVGLGYGVDSIESDETPLGKLEGTAKGFGGATELAAGYTITDGLVLGGGLYSFWFSPTMKDPKGFGLTAQGGKIEYDTSSFHVLGPFVDYYTEANEGLHLQGALGLGWIDLGDAHPQGINISVNGMSASGFGLMLGVGEEFWVADGWSLGLLGRLTMGFLSGDDDSGNLNFSHTAIAPALLFTATMN